MNRSADIYYIGEVSYAKLEEDVMIITVTMNPAVDKTARAASIVPGGLNRLGNIARDAGGKGINVSKMIKVLGGESIATGFLGGSAGKDILAALAGLKIKADFVSIDAATRTNLKVYSEDFGITEFNEPGPAVTSDEMDALKRKLLEYAEPAAIFVFAGSLTQGACPGIYGQLICEVKKKGASVFLDADGEAFSKALLAKPDYVKPNKFELLQYFGIQGDCALPKIAELCRGLINQGIKTVNLSMGEQGALFVTGQELLYAPGLTIKAASTVGAGDSMVAAAAYGFSQGMSLKDTAALAMAASAGAAATEGTNPPARKTVDELLKQVKFQDME